jgi:disulfide oxidoreductase YuzD
MGGVLRVAFKDQPQGSYTMQFMDIAGKLISSRQVNISSRQQVEEYALPELTARGNYLLKVVSETKQVVGINKVVVQ